MKKFQFIVLLIFLIAGCKKDDTENKQEKENAAPVAVAGDDITIYWPSAYAILDGNGSYDPDGPNSLSYHWKLVSGPTPVSVYSADSSSTAVGNLLSPGVYEFELSVKEQQGSDGSDKIKVTVVDRPCTSPANEIIFEDQPWYTDPESGSPYMDFNLYSILPSNSNLREVYIKRDSSTEWEPVRVWDAYSDDFNIFPIYSFGFGKLNIFPPYSVPASDTPDIKIIYCKIEGPE